MAQKLHLVTALALLAACAAGPPEIVGDPPAARAQDDIPLFSYTIGVGDVLRVNVFGQPELSSSLLEGGQPGSPVGSGGTVALPLIGEIAVAGKTVDEATAAIEAALSTYLKEPHADVAIVRFGAHRVLVLGEVTNPGAYVLERPLRAMEALSLSGGFGPFANRRQVAWVDGDLDPDSMRLFDATELDVAAAGWVRSGDVIFVGRKSWADVATAARDLLPILTLVTTPVSIGLQAATLSKIDR